MSYTSRNAEPLTFFKINTKHFRKPRTTQELREKDSPYVRTKRKHIPTNWDDISRYFPKSWKDCTKKQKQYM